MASSTSVRLTTSRLGSSHPILDEAYANNPQPTDARCGQCLDITGRPPGWHYASAACPVEALLRAAVPESGQINFQTAAQPKPHNAPDRVDGIQVPSGYICRRPQVIWQDLPPNNCDAPRHCPAISVEACHSNSRVNQCHIDPTQVLARSHGAR